MRATDLDDICKGFALGQQRDTQLGDGGQQLVLDGRHRSHMHGRGIDIVAGLAFVHIVIRVHQTGFTALAAHQLAGPVGQHLVDVHIGLGAGAGLPDHQGELIGVLAREHLIGGRIDGSGFFLVQQTQRLVDAGRGLFDLRQRSNDFTRLLLAADVKILQRALRLRAPELVGGYIDQAKSVFFLAGDCHGIAPCNTTRRSWLKKSGCRWPQTEVDPPPGRPLPQPVHASSARQAASTIEATPLRRQGQKYIVTLNQCRTKNPTGLAGPPHQCSLIFPPPSPPPS